MRQFLAKVNLGTTVLEQFVRKQVGVKTVSCCRTVFVEEHRCLDTWEYGPQKREQPPPPGPSPPFQHSLAFYEAAAPGWRHTLSSKEERQAQTHSPSVSQ